MKAAALAAIAAGALVLAGCGSGGSRAPAGAASPPAVPQLRSIAELRAVFNAHTGVPRLLVLIAPT